MLENIARAAIAGAAQQEHAANGAGDPVETKRQHVRTSRSM